MRPSSRCSGALAAAESWPGPAGADPPAARRRSRDRRPPAREGADVVLITIDTLRADAAGLRRQPPGARPRCSTAWPPRGGCSPTPTPTTWSPSPRTPTSSPASTPSSTGCATTAASRLPPKVPTLATAAAAAPATPPGPSSAPIRSTPGSASTRGSTSTTTTIPRGSNPDEFVIAERRGDEVVAAALAWWDAQPGKPPLPLGPPLRPARRLRSAGAVRQPLPGQPLPRRGRRRRLLPRAAPRPVPGRQGAAGPGDRHRRPRRVARRARRADARPVRLRGDAQGAAGRLGARASRPGRDGRAGAPRGHRADGAPAAGARRRRPGLPGRSLLAPAAPGGDPYFESLSHHPEPRLGAAARHAARRHEADRPAAPRALRPAEATRRRSTTSSPRTGGRPHACARRCRAESAWPPPRGAVSAEEEARLRSLGYSAGAARRRRTSYTAADDPKNLVGVDRKLHEVIDAYSRRRYDGGRRLWPARWSPSGPTCAEAYEHLALALRQLERPRRGDRGRCGAACGAAATASRSAASSASPSPRRGGPAEAVDVLQPLAARPGRCRQPLNAYAHRPLRRRPAGGGRGGAAAGSSRTIPTIPRGSRTSASSRCAWTAGQAARTAPRQALAAQPEPADRLEHPRRRPLPAGRRRPRRSTPGERSVAARPPAIRRPVQPRPGGRARPGGPRQARKALDALRGRPRRRHRFGAGHREGPASSWPSCPS